MCTVDGASTHAGSVQYKYILQYHCVSSEHIDMCTVQYSHMSCTSCITSWHYDLHVHVHVQAYVYCTNELVV